MSLFRSNKNKSASAASAASTPAQTPRTSMQGSRPLQANTMTPEQAVEIALNKCVHYSSISYRILVHEEHALQTRSDVTARHHETDVVSVEVPEVSVLSLAINSV
ncbi:hypothetical protein BGX20_009918 [Mortierella sp. AD010]|nr:hypothetical protein BGX20_009918 [Mortierella sp. AD010]